jgi:hypothetical protein
MKINLEELKKTLEKLQKVKEEVKNSKHAALSVDPDSDFEPYEESLTEWFKTLDLPKSSFSDEIPEEYWSSIFNIDDEHQDDYELIKTTEEYKNLLKVYVDVYSDIYTACLEECAYYENEAQDYERYLDSMRGPL